MPNNEYAAYEPANPYFDLVRGALGELVGEHFFDIVTDDVIYEVLYDVAGWPRTIRGRADLMTQFKGYCDNIEIESADNLITHTTQRGVAVHYSPARPKIARRAAADVPDPLPRNGGPVKPLPVRFQ
jgi:hypothetical protein